MMKREFKVQQGKNRTGYKVTNWARFVREGAR